MIFSFSTHYALQKFFIKSIKLYYHNWLWFLYNKYCLVVMFNQCQNKAIFIIWDLWNILFWDCWNVKAVWVDWFVGWSSSITVSLFVLSCKVRILKRGAKIYVRRLKILIFKSTYCITKCLFWCNNGRFWMSVKAYSDILNHTQGVPFTPYNHRMLVSTKDRVHRRFKLDF